MQIKNARMWPTHWAGGWGSHRSGAPNLTEIRADVDGKEVVVAYLEHHGPGSWGDRYPTEQDYDVARAIIDALREGGDK